MTHTDSQSGSELKQIGTLIEAIYQVDSLEELFRRIVTIVPDFIAADRVSVTLYDGQRQQVYPIASYGAEDPQGQLRVGERVSIDKHYQQYHDSVCEPTIWRPSKVEESIRSSTATIKPLMRMQLRSVMNVPIFQHGKVVGTLNVGSKSLDYQPAELARLQQITTLVGIAAERIVHTEMEQAASLKHRLYAEHLELLNTLGEKLSLVSSIDEALGSVSDCAEILVNAIRISYCVLEPGGDNIKITGLIGATSDSPGQVVPLERSGLAEVLIDGRQRYLTDLINSDVGSQRSLGESGINHLWSFPIVGDNTIIGALNIGSNSIELSAENATSVLATLSRFLGSSMQRLEAQQQTMQMLAEIEQQARTDTLTGLPNRKEFFNRLALQIQTAESAGSQIGVFFLDLDLFKNVNDTLGHAIGDQLLCSVSQRLKNLLKDDETIARIGGDEFLLLTTQPQTREMLSQIGEDLVNAIRQPIPVAERMLEVGVSIGAVCYPDDGHTGDELVKNADIAMYHAKASGRNQCRVFSDQLSESVSRRVRLESLLREAISAKQLSLVFQPQYDFNSSRPVAVEALLRWIHPVEGFIPPDEFIGVAEQCGLIEDITDWVLEHSLECVKKFRQYHPDLRVAVNVSASEFSSHNALFDRVSSALEVSGMPSDALELELTETALLSHPEHAISLIEKFSSTGIQIAIDDFGTGYASMSYLIQLPINTIKIDRSFIDGLEHDTRKQSVVKGILAIANGMDLYSVGEGVETVEQFGWLNRYGCQSAQGYLLSRPVSPDQVPEVLQQLGGSQAAA